MNGSRQSPIPEIYILWHPACSLGEGLARKIYSWLRPGNGLGPQVFFRSMTAPRGVAGGLPVSLPGEPRDSMSDHGARPRATNVQIVLPLIEANMVADQTWRHWLSQLASAPLTQNRRVFMPIALDMTAYNCPAPIRDLNFLRPGPARGQTPDEGTDAVEALSRSLLKQLTESLCRFMLNDRQDVQTIAPEDRTLLPKLKIFLSHAKADGTLPARRLRDYIYSQTQLAAFYDENDIAFGALFKKVLEDDLTSRDTAALIAVRTARYASRPWCRREISMFRSPRRDPLAGDREERWILYPTLVVEALEPGANTSGVPEFGNSSCVRWDESVPDQEEQIVTTLLRDVMLGAFHAALGAAIPPRPGQIVLNWLPDPTTLLSIERVRSGQECDVVHPGRGLSGLELDTLAEFFPQLTFHSFEEVLL